MNQYSEWNLSIEEKFNLTTEFCSNIENYTNTTQYTEVEKEVKMMMALACVMMLIMCR